MKKIKPLSILAALVLGVSTAVPAQAANVIYGLNGELVPMRGPGFPDNPEDTQTTLLGGLYVGTSGLELRPNIIYTAGEYQGLIIDAGLRITPKWFGQPEYLWGFVSPYAVVGGSYGVPNSWGWLAKGGIGLGLGMFTINGEMGYRSHRLTDTQLLEGTTLTLRAGMPF